MNTEAAPNAGQIAYWNDQAGRTWAELGALLDRQIEGVGLRAMAALSPTPGQRLLDVGCGGGQTSLELARRVGPSGRVVGVDISRPMLEVARTRARQAGATNLSFVEADAQAYAFEPARFDGVFSRFGVMFFADPPAAFGNLLSAMASGGRLAFVCWRSLAENPWMGAPATAAASLLPPAPPPEPGAPGPFAFADPERVKAILASAGFADVKIAPVDMPIGGNSLEESVTLSLRVGPLGARLREAPELAPKVTALVRDYLATHLSDGAVWMPGAVWIATGRRA